MELVALAPATAPHFHPPQRTSSPVRGTVRGQTERTRSRSTWSASVAATWTAATLLRSPRARRRRPPHRPGSQVGRKATGSDNRYKSLEAFLEAQRESPPTTDPLGGPLTPYNDSPVDWIFIAVFRQVMSGVASWQSPLAFWGTEAYDGMLETGQAPDEARTRSDAMAPTTAIATMSRCTMYDEEKLAIVEVGGQQVQVEIDPEEGPKLLKLDGTPGGPNDVQRLPYCPRGERPRSNNGRLAFCSGRIFIFDSVRGRRANKTCSETRHVRSHQALERPVLD
eukprot:g22606.t1